VLDKTAQITAASQIVARKMSVREAEGLVKKLGTHVVPGGAKPKPDKSRDHRRIEEELSDLLAAEVEVRVKKRVRRAGRTDQSGELAIRFASLDELGGLIERLRKS
jgi:ParB family chromosome partitioning protein